MNRNIENAVESLSEMSKADYLRGFVTERLAAASREILAAVDRLVSGYEEEASGFKQEIDRQRKQLETLQQPQPAFIESGGNCSRSFSHDEDEDEEEEDEDELTEDMNTKTPKRCKTGNSDRPPKSQEYVHLNVCILEDSQPGLPSKHVCKKCPVLELKCPRGLQEAEFMNLLRTSFPQLADHKHFDILLSNKSQRLRHLKLNAVTPEEIRSNISCTDLERSTLYIRLKAQKEPQSNENGNPLLQTRDMNSKDFLSTSDTLTFDENRPRTSKSDYVFSTSLLSCISPLQSSSSTSQENMETVKADDVGHSIAEGTGINQADLQEGKEEVEGDQMDGSQSNKVKKQKCRHSCVKANDPKCETSDDGFSCKVCGELHRSEVNTVKHAWSHMDDSGSVCGVCGAESDSADTLKDHIQNQHKTKDCHICGESFLSVPSLNEHVAAHSGESETHDELSLKTSVVNHQKLQEANRTHKCYTCHEVFELKEQLVAHYGTHVNKKTHLCGVCGKSLSDYRSLSRHKFTHTGERPHSCKACGRRFKLIGALRQHEKTHMDRERSYLCDVCCKMFLTSKQLQIHMRTHTNEKPYHCSECGKGFTTRGPLTIHMRVHTGETPYRCPDCGWSFKRKSNLDDHLTVHSGVKAFVCGICGKACARKTHLTVHMRTHNGERPYKCSECDKAFTQSHCLKTHMRSHQRGEAQMQH